MVYCGTCSDVMVYCGTCSDVMVYSGTCSDVMVYYTVWYCNTIGWQSCIYTYVEYPQMCSGLLFNTLHLLAI